MKLKKTVKRIIKSNVVTRRLAQKIRNRREKKRVRKLLEKRLESIKIDKFVNTQIKPDANVIIITIDCLRYRHLSFTGYDRETTPFLDSLKIKFKAISTAPWTYPSVSSIMTGLYPHVHGADFKTKIRHLNDENLSKLRPLRNNVITLSEIFYSLGYDILSLSTIYVANHALKGRVIPEYYLGKPEAKVVLEDIKKRLLKIKKPFFTYIHLGDLHIPIRISKKFRNYFEPIKDLKNLEAWDYIDFNSQNGKSFEEYKYNRILLYDSALRYVDSMLEDFYNFLEKKGILDNTLLVITSDHGEALWEHAEEEYRYFYNPKNQHGVGHGHNLFWEQIEVPILFDGGLIKSSKNYSDFFVSTVDIAPTILNLIGIEHNLYLNGVDLLKVRKNEKRLILSEAIAYGYEKKALITERYKLLYSPKDKIKWVFDLQKDKLEKEPIIDKNIVEELVKKMKRYMIKNKLKFSRHHETK